MANFTIETKQIGDAFIIRSHGYLDETGGAVVLDAVQKAFPLGAKNFILNFHDSPVINSQGIAQIIELSEMIVDEREGELGFIGLSELSSGVFKMVGLLQMADVYTNEEEALAEFS